MGCILVPCLHVNGAPKNIKQQLGESLGDGKSPALGDSKGWKHLGMRFGGI